MSLLVSIATPVYDMNGKGVEFLAQNLKKTFSQIVNFEIEIIISDQSNNNDIEDYIHSLCNPCIKYFREPNRGNHSCNTNNALTKCNGDIIKILYQDDYFLNEFSLKKTVDDMLEKNAKWLVSACEHSTDGLNLIRPLYPYWNENMIYGINTYSAPSVVSLRKETRDILFDENLLYMPDVDYYYRMRLKYGEPLYLNEITIVNMVHDGQTQKIMSDRYNKDLEYIKIKYKI